MKQKRWILFLLVFMIGMLMVGCGEGNLKNSKELYQRARKKYGSCTIVSKEEAEEKTVLVLHDEAQDFDYEIKSEKYNLMFDATSFGYHYSTTDNFNLKLLQKILDNLSDELNEFDYEIRYGTDPLSLEVYVKDKTEAKETGFMVAKLLQTQNLKRLNMKITVRLKDNPNDWYGIISMPDMNWTESEFSNKDPAISGLPHQCQ